MKNIDHGKQIMCFEATRLILSKFKNCSKKSIKVQRAKKHKCIAEPVPLMIDDTKLLETPIQLSEDGNEWALVASPNKPPATI